MASSYFDVARARACGIAAAYSSPDELYVHSSSGVDNATLRRVDTTRALLPRHDVLRALTGMKSYQDSIGVGCGGWGVDVHLLLTLPPVLLWFAVILLVRYVCRTPIARFGVYMGVVTENSARYRERVAAGKRGIAALSRRNRRKLFKFQNQVWLSVYYVASTIFGYVVQYDKPWFALPLRDDSGLHLLLPHPQPPPAELMLYYHYELAFYLSETVSLLYIEADVKRSDFVEYLLHHCITLALIVCSHLAWEHRFGVYVLFLHDASDILLCLSKSLHYMVEEEQARAARYQALHGATTTTTIATAAAQHASPQQTKKTTNVCKADKTSDADDDSSGGICDGCREDASSSSRRSGSSSSTSHSSRDSSSNDSSNNKNDDGGSNDRHDDNSGCRNSGCRRRSRQAKPTATATAATMAVATRTAPPPRYESHVLFRYVLTETTTNVCFAGFIAVFVYLRLFCLPMMLRTTFAMAARVRHGNVNMWALVVLLNVGMQALHVYWAALIFRMVYQLLRGGARKDIRSDADDDGEPPDVVSCSRAAVPRQLQTPPPAAASSSLQTTVTTTTTTPTLAALRIKQLDAVVTQLQH